MPRELTYTLAERRKLLELARDAERATLELHHWLEELKLGYLAMSSGRASRALREVVCEVSLAVRNAENPEVTEDPKTWGRDSTAARDAARAEWQTAIERERKRRAKAVKPIVTPAPAPDGRASISTEAIDQDGHPWTVDIPVADTQPLEPNPTEAEPDNEDDEPVLQ